MFLKVEKDIRTTNKPHLILTSFKRRNQESSLCKLTAFFLLLFSSKFTLIDNFNSSLINGTKLKKHEYLVKNLSLPPSSPPAAGTIGSCFDLVLHIHFQRYSNHRMHQHIYKMFLHK